MSFPYDNRTHYTQQGDRRYDLTVFAALWRISSQTSRFPRLFRYPEGEASRASQVYAGPTLSARRIGRLREPRSLALVVLRSFCQQGSTAWQPVSDQPTRATPPASVTVELTFRRRYVYVGSTQRGGHRVGHLPSRPSGSLRKHPHSYAATRRVRALFCGVRPARDLFFPHYAGQGGHPDGHLLLHLYGLGTVTPTCAHASGTSLRSRLPDDGRRGHAFLRQGRVRLRPRLRRFRLDQGPGRRHEAARTLRLPEDVEVGVGQARGAHRHGGRAVVGEALRRAVLSVRGHLGPARTLGRARVLHFALPCGLRGTPDLPQLRQVGGGRTHQG